MLGRVYEVFTKAYKKETEYREFMGDMLDKLKLNNNSEDVEQKVKRLTDRKFVSNFKIKVGEN